MRYWIKQSSLILLLGLIVSLGVESVQAQSGREYRRTGIHNANLVKTVFGNWGVIGQPAQRGPRGAWIYDTNGYIGDVSPLVGAEVAYYDSVTNQIKKFHSVVVCPVDRPYTGPEESPSGKLWTFEPVAGYFNENQEKVAMSTNPNSWPGQWPDKMDDPEDPGWPGQWNGFFGKGVTNADQESYFVMDDNNDEEFNYSQYNNLLEPSNPNGRGVAFKPDSTNPLRNGLGLQVKVRGMQWQQFLAADVIFWLYEVTNTSTTDYDQVTFGMLAGTYVGVTGTDDSPHEYDDDYSFFDVQRDLTYTGDYPNNNSRNPKWQDGVGMVGYAFLESPGNPFDGIDNDGDNKEDAHPEGTSLIFTAPLFEESDFQSVTYNIGDQVVVIDDDFNRSLVTIQQDTQVVHTHGADITVIAGRTHFVEGNVLPQGTINQNVYDGVDNDLDGLIDENYFLHYRQLRKDQNGNTLIDTLNPVAYINYRTGQGENDPLIDERRDDGIDNDGDWNPEFDDVGADGKAGTNDRGEGDGVPTAGEPNFDQTDTDESDQIGLTSFNYFTPANEFPMEDDEKLWEWLKPGYFDVPNSIVNNQPVAGEDGDFIYGSAYFPLRAGQTERFSLALVYGNDIQDLLKNRKTVQDIYDSDYRFPQPPDKPTVSVVPGDGKVTLYWDRKAENSVDPVTKERDFEGYKIYKATDPNFNDVRSITNANGVITGYEWLAQFDKKNDVSGLFQPSPDLFQEAEGYTFNLGSNSGLKHSYVDTEVENGRRYFYAVVAYDRGDPTKDIYPSENTKFISVQPDGQIITDQNTDMVRPGPPVAGYDSQNANNQLDHMAGPSSGNIYYDVVDETQLNGHSYRVNFTDTQTDRIDNDNDWDPLTDDVGSDGIPNTQDADSTENNGVPNVGEPNFEWLDPQEFAPVTSTYSVLDLTGHEETVHLDTQYVALDKTHIIQSSTLISRVNNPGNYLSLTKFDLDTLRGKIRIKPGSGLSENDYHLNYQYYPVYKSSHIQNSPYADETFDTDIFDGVELRFKNDWNIQAKSDTSSYWNTGDRRYNWAFTTGSVDLGAETITGQKYPGIYEIQFGDSIMYTTPPEFQDAPFYFPAIHSNFRIVNKVDSVTVPFLFVRPEFFNPSRFNPDSTYGLKPGDFLETFWQRPDSTYQYTWTIAFTNLSSDPEDTVYTFGEGDVLHIATTRPYRHTDVYDFTTQEPTVVDSVAKNSLDDIQVVPNPYVVANNMEAPLPPAITSGRGERRIEFRGLPTDAKVHIFTSNGAHLITLNQNGNIHSGSLAWNLKTKENLDVAYGIYFYVVESKVGKKSGKIAVIK